MIKRIGILAAIVILMLIIFNLAKSTYDLWQKKELLEEARLELKTEEALNKKLQAGLSMVQTKEFIEEEARNKLFMVRPGEQEIIMDEDLLKKDEPKKEIELPNWKKWINLFF